MKTILKPCLTTILLSGYGNLKDIQEMMQDNPDSFWIQKGKQSPIPSHREFFEKEFHNRLFDFTKNSIYTKLQSLLNSPTFDNFTSGESTIDLERLVRR